MTDLSAAISHVEAALGCNRFLYWLGRIPLLRRLFPPPCTPPARPKIP